MIDRLHRLAGRPIRDGDRLRLFALVVALIIGAAGLLAFLDEPAPAPSGTAPPVPTAETVRTYTRDPLPASSAPAIRAAPSEETDLPATQLPKRDDIVRSKRAARRFLRQYLAYSYGQAPASTITAATAALRDDLEDARLRVPAVERRRRARVELLQTNGVSRERADVLAVISDGERRYSLRLQLANSAAGWLVIALER